MASTWLFGFQRGRVTGKWDEGASGGEVLDTASDVQAAVAVRRFGGDVRRDAEPHAFSGGFVRISLWHFSMIDDRHSGATAPHSTHPTFGCRSGRLGRPLCAPALNDGS